MQYPGYTTQHLKNRVAKITTDLNTGRKHSDYRVADRMIVEIYNREPDYTPPRLELMG